jgi:hypothetical protein
VGFDYFSRLAAGSKLVVPLLQALAVAGALSALDYFHAHANVEIAVRPINVWYDKTLIAKSMAEVGVDLVDSVYSWKPAHAEIVDNPDFRDRESVRRELLEESAFGAPASREKLCASLRFKFHETGVSDSRQMGFVNNSEFWEESFPELISGLVDDTTYRQALYSTIAGREVTTMLYLMNNGSAAAQDVNVYLDQPLLFEPRTLTGRAKVRYIDIEAEHYLVEASVDSQSARLSVPYMKPGETQHIYVTTSMANVTTNNVSVEYKTDRTLRVTQILYVLVFCIVMFYGVLPLLRRPTSGV